MPHSVNFPHEPFEPAMRDAALRHNQDRLLSRQQVRDLGISFTRQHIHYLEQQGMFPRRVKLGAQRVAWVESEIVEWINNRIAARDETGR